MPATIKRSHMISESEKRETARLKSADARRRNRGEKLSTESRTEAEGRLQAALCEIFVDSSLEDARSFFRAAGITHVLMEAGETGDIWTPFRDHYTTGGEIDEQRFATDFAKWPPIASRIMELTLSGQAGHA